MEAQMKGDVGQAEATDVADLYNRVASRYGSTGPAVFAHFGQRLVDLAALAPGEHVLDVGAGRGAILFPAAARVGTRGQVTGIDVAEVMVEETCAEIKRAGITNATMRVMDGEHLTFPDTSFDAVLCGFAIFFLDIERALTEFYRVLRAGGRMAVNCGAALDERWRWYNDLLITYHDVYGVPLSPPRRGASWEPSALPTLVARAGFTDVRAVTEEAEFTYADEQEWWHSKWTHGARYPLERMRADVLERFRAEAFAKLVPLRQPDGFRECWRILTVIGARPV
jgi:SAM-dependent methyltransferase